MEKTLKRNRLEGELRYVEGRTTVKDFLKDIASQLVKQEWIDYKNGDTYVWNFDLKREIWLPNAFKSESIKLYKATKGVGTEYTKGELITGSEYKVVGNIIRGVGEKQETQIGERVFIEVVYEMTEFERPTFQKILLPSGQEKNVATLKSRPQGAVEIYKDTLEDVTDELLHQEGGNLVYHCSRSPISNSAKHLPVIKKDGVVVEASEYTVDYFNGLIIFNGALEDANRITATYKYKTGKRGEKITPDKYNMYDNKIIDKTALGELEGLDVIIDVNYYWDLAYPETVAAIKDRVILKASVDISEQKDRGKVKDYYWEIKYINSEDAPLSQRHKTGVECRFGSLLKEDDLLGKTLDEVHSSEWSKWSWYKETAFDKGVVFDEWLNINYWLNHTAEYTNIVIQGDAAPDTDYSNYIISYAYVGMLKEYDNAKQRYLDGNFGMTVGSDIFPESDEEFSTKWGVKTGTGVTDMCMASIQGTVFQAVLPAFYTSPEFMDKHFISTSEMTGSHHASEITMCHSTARELAKMQGVLVLDRSCIFHQDVLISNKDIYDSRGALVDTQNNIKDANGNLIQSQEKHWVMLNVNAPYSILTNSPNIHYGICIRKK